MTEKPERRSRGRPPVEGRLSPGGQSAPVFLRVTPDLRRALEDESKRVGRPMAQVAERWMEEARTGRADSEYLLGAGRVAGVMKQLIAFAHAVRQEIGEPEIDPAGRAALMEGWAYLIPRVLLASGITPDQIRRAELRAQIRTACVALIGQRDALVPQPTTDLALIERCAVGSGPIGDAEVAAIRTVCAQLPWDTSQSLKILAARIEEACDAYGEAMGEATRLEAEGRMRGRELASEMLRQPDTTHLIYDIQDGEMQVLEVRSPLPSAERDSSEGQ